MTERTKVQVAAGNQASFAMISTPTAMIITNLGSTKNAEIKYAWMFNEANLIATPAVNPLMDIGPAGGRTIQPVQISGVNPATFVRYNDGPSTIEVEPLY